MTITYKSYIYIYTQCYAGFAYKFPSQIHNKLYIDTSSFSCSTNNIDYIINFQIYIHITNL